MKQEQVKLVLERFQKLGFTGNLKDAVIMELLRTIRGEDARAAANRLLHGETTGEWIAGGVVELEQFFEECTELAIKVAGQKVALLEELRRLRNQLANGTGEAESAAERVFGSMPLCVAAVTRITLTKTGSTKPEYCASFAVGQREVVSTAEDSVEKAMIKLAEIVGVSQSEE